MPLVHEKLTEQIIGAAIEVHRALGPGMLESAYEQCLCHELTLRGLAFRRQVPWPVMYKGIKLDCAYRLDLLVEESVIVEVKAVEAVESVHRQQLLSYMKASTIRVGLLINFNTAVLTDGGIIRRVL